MRAAIYFTPPADAPLTRLAADWLGRDAFDGAAARPLDAERAAIVAEPARYGFHATMKAPFRLADDATLPALDEALASFCAAHSAPTIARLALRRIAQFFALVPDETEPALDKLAGECVRGFERFRAPLSTREWERRRPETLTTRQRRHLEDWGYPHVFEDFRFHMTLTGRVPDEAAAPIEATLARHFEPLLGQPLPVDGLALFVEPEPGGPFVVHSRHPLRSQP